MHRSFALCFLAAPLLVAFDAADAPRSASLAAAFDDDPQEVSLLELANVEWKKGQDLPKEITDLKGEKVKLVGYMALDTEEGQETFRMSYESCSCSSSKVTHFVKVKMPKGKVTSFEPGLIEVVGTFYAGAKYDDDGFVDSVFRTSASSVKAR
ncbi:MAG: hypothetical protein KDC14_13160 [Planctomycetes bacterium]|nr:hypothetical protein [Planctomycetota bacterium]